MSRSFRNRRTRLVAAGAVAGRGGAAIAAARTGDDGISGHRRLAKAKAAALARPEAARSPAPRSATRRATTRSR